jgi:predicted DNA-binding transcriptional regulator YafY
MPQNKNYDLRKKIIDGLITRKKFNKEGIFEEVNERLVKDGYGSISWRQLGNDLSAMKTEAYSMGGEIKYSRANGAYYYEPADFSLTGIPVSREDFQVLAQTLAILKQVSGFSKSRELESIIERLGEKLGIETKEIGEVLVFDEVPGLKGIEHLNELLKMVIDKMPILISYQPYTEERPQLVRVHPYFLKEYNGRWYLFGWNEDADAIHNYALDRIQVFEEHYVRFNESKRVTAREWLKDVVGVTRRDGEPELITFTIRKPRAYYVDTKPIHPSQEKVDENKKQMTFTINVIPNKELESVFLSFGEDLIKMPV